MRTYFAEAADRLPAEPTMGEFTRELTRDELLASGRRGGVVVNAHRVAHEMRAFDPIAADDGLFRAVQVEYGTLVWPGGIDIAPETLIWDGPNPEAGTSERPTAYLRPKQPV